MSATQAQRWLRLIAAALVCFILQAAPVRQAAAAAPRSLTIEDLSTGLSPNDLAEALLGTGVSISNVNYTGAPSAAGTFSGGDGIVGFAAGVVLSTGDVNEVVGPNNSDSESTNFRLPGDADLSALSGFATFDAAVLTFDFVPAGNTLFFRFVFASEEYNEFVNTQFNDAFAFFVNGENCATIAGGEAITINTINNGNPIGVNPSNPEFYINNDLSDGGGAVDIEADGLTVVLNCAAAAVPNQSNTMKLAIADASDRVLDTMIFLEAGSFSTTASVTLTPEAATLCSGEVQTFAAFVTDEPSAGVDVTFAVTAGPNAGLSAVVTTGVTSQATWSYSSTAAGTDLVTASFISSEGLTVASAPATIDWQGCGAASVVLTPPFQFVCLDEAAQLEAQITDVMVDGVKVALEVVSGPNAGLGRTVATDATGQAGFAYPGTVDGVDTVIVSFEDASGVLRESEPVDVIWETCTFSEITLLPATQTVCVFEGAALSATVVSPFPDGIPVTFEVVAGPNLGLTAEAFTAADGTALLDYFGGAPGVDTVQASFMDDFGNVIISNAVEVVWDACVIPEVFLDPFEQVSCLEDAAEVTASVIDANPAGIPVTFEVVAGPNIGVTAVIETDPDGVARFSYGGSGEGTDTVEASFTAADGSLQISNPATVLWVDCTPLCSVPTMFGVHDENSRDSQLFTIDLGSGVAAPLGPLHDNFDIESLELDPLDGTLYALAGGDSVVAGDVFVVDKETGDLTTVGNTGATGYAEITASAFHPDGTLWAFQQTVGLLTVDLATAETSFVWNPAPAGLGDNWEGLAWDFYGTALYGAQGRKLYRYDPATNSAEQLCGDTFLPGETEALSLRADGALLGGWHNATNDTLRIFRIDYDACAITSADYDVPYNDVESIAFDVCEPEGAIGGLFLTTTGEPLPRGTELAVYGAGPDALLNNPLLDGGGRSGDDVLYGVAMVGADGRFSFRGLPADTYTVVIDAADLPAGTVVSNYPFSVTLGPGETYEHGVVPTAAPLTVTGASSAPRGSGLAAPALALLLLTAVVWRRRERRTVAR